MSYIVPTGDKKLNWNPEQVVKTASTSVPEVKEDSLYAAAKKFMESKKVVVANENCDEAKKEDKPVEAEKTEKKDPMIVETKEESKEEVAETPAEAPAEAPAECPCKEEVKDAVAEIKDAVEKVEDAVGIAGEAAPKDEAKEIEFEIPEAVDEVEIEIEDEAPAAIPGDEMIVETGAGCMASSKDEFVKLSAISPETRKKIVKFWKDDLGFPADYVALMAKDYEK